MVEEPQATTHLLKRGNELNFLAPTTAATATVSPLVQGEDKDLMIQQQALKPVPEKSTELSPQQANRKLLARQQSITRGTASSLAKAVRSPPAESNANATETLIKRRLSAAVRNRKQSLTTAPSNGAMTTPAVENKQLLNVGLPSTANGQRRSSWSPPQQQQHPHQITTTVVPELPSSPSPSPPPPLRKVFEAKRRASMIPSSTSPDHENNDSSIRISSSNNVDNKINQRRRSSMLLQKRPSKYPSVMNNTDDGSTNINKPASASVVTNDMNNNNNAASCADNQQKTPRSKSDADGMVAVINEASSAFNTTQPTPDVMVADEVIAIRRSLSQSTSSSTTSSSLEHHHHHHHTHTHNSEDDHLPGYMRRPICAACNRNVKVTSSSESTTAAAAAAAALVTKSHSTVNSSRRSSVSTTATTTSKGHDVTYKKRNVARSKSSHTDRGAATPNLVSATSSLSTAGSNHSIQSMMSSSSSSGSNHSNSNLQGGPTHRVLRSHSPTSPIPTRRRTKKKSNLTNPLTNTMEPYSADNTTAVIRKPSRQLLEKWSQLLSQQQLLLATIGGKDMDADADDDMNSIQQNITKLVTSSQEQYETVLLETQAKILQKFTLLMMQQQQQQQQQQKDALLFLSSSSSASGVSGSAASITPINIYNATNHPTTTAITSSTVATQRDHVPASPSPSPSPSTSASALPSCNWQTKLEYKVTRFKWNMSQWIGSLVGTGDIEEQDFDALGYPKNIIISGVCVTTEPGLLPKGLQKYFKPYQQPDQVICHKYMIHLTRQSRLTKFQLLNPKDWVQDDHVDKCQFQIQDRHDYIKRTKHCSTEFGVFRRRHHCRSCGHVFCQEHSSNKLPLFVSNGQDCGEWARVCDTCFYSRIEPQLLSRT